MSDLLEKYMSLNDTEKKSFEKQLTKEEQKELARELGIMEGLTESFRQELKNKVSAFEIKSTRARQMNPAYIGIAASFFIVAFITVYFLQGNKAVAFEDYYEPYPNYEVTALRGDEDMSGRQKAYQYYDNGKYQKAYEEFVSLEASENADYFFLAISSIELKKYDLALQNLHRVIKSEDTNYLHPAQWYSALVYVKLGKTNEAKELLDSLIANRSEYSDQARELIQEL